MFFQNFRPFNLLVADEASIDDPGSEGKNGKQGVGGRAGQLNLTGQLIRT